MELGLWIFLSLVVCVIHLQQPFSRNFIYYDDHHFVQPMLDLSLGEYFARWLPDRALLGFPVRDLIFMLEHKIGLLLGFNVFAFFTVALFIWSVRLFSDLLILLRTDFHLRWGVLFLWATHPLLLESLQWIWIQKLVLAYWFILFATKLVLTRYQTQNGLDRSDWIKVSTLWMASILCWPTTMLWPIFPLTLFWKKLTATLRVYLSLAFSGTIIIYFIIITGGSERDYRPAGESIFTNLERTFDFAVNSFGRASFNFLFPFRLAMYYNIESPLNKIGIAVGIALIALLAWGWRRQLLLKTDKILLFWSLLLFTPQCLPFLGYSNFIWADRYMYVILPVFLLLVLRVLGADFTRRSWQIGLAMSCLALSYLSFVRAPFWRDDLKLAMECGANERAPYCEFLELEKKHDRVGCPESFFVSDRLSTQYARYQNPYAFYIRFELPFYHALCLGQSQTDDPAISLQELKRLETLYNHHPHLAIGPLILLAKSKNYDQAIQLLSEFFERTSYVRKDSTSKQQMIYAGILMRICDLTQSPRCPDLKRKFFENSGLGQDIYQRAAFSFGYKILSP